MSRVNSSTAVTVYCLVLFRVRTSVLALQENSRHRYAERRTHAIGMQSPQLLPSRAKFDADSIVVDNAEAESELGELVTRINSGHGLWRFLRNVSNAGYGSSSADVEENELLFRNLLQLGIDPDVPYVASNGRKNVGTSSFVIFKVPLGGLTLIVGAKKWGFSCKVRYIGDPLRTSS